MQNSAAVAELRARSTVGGSIVQSWLPRGRRAPEARSGARRVVPAAAARRASRRPGRSGGSTRRTSRAPPAPPLPKKYAGYWLVASDGGMFTFGNAKFYGSTGGMHLNQPIVGMAAHASGNGYWLVASDGGMFTFGDAQFYGSTGGMHLNQPIVGMARTPSGHGYWLVASDGGMFSFGDAHFYGSTGGHAPEPADRRHGADADRVTATGWSRVTAGCSASATRSFYGSTGGRHLNQPIVGMAPHGRAVAGTGSSRPTAGCSRSATRTSTARPAGSRWWRRSRRSRRRDRGHGYWLVGANGDVFPFGDAMFFGSTGGRRRSIDPSSWPRRQPPALTPAPSRYARCRSPRAWSGDVATEAAAKRPRPSSSRRCSPPRAAAVRSHQAQSREIDATRRRSTTAASRPTRTVITIHPGWRRRSGYQRRLPVVAASTSRSTEQRRGNRAENGRPRGGTRWSSRRSSPGRRSRIARSTSPSPDRSTDRPRRAADGRGDRADAR